MSYRFYLDGILLPVAPGSVQIKYGNRLKKNELVSGKEIVLGYGDQVFEIAFSAVLPQTEYPFADYEGGFKKGGDILDDIKELKEKGTPFRFIIARKSPSGKKMFSTNVKAVFSELRVREDAADGTDIRADIKLTEYRNFAVKKVKKSDGDSGAEKPPSRPEDSKPEPDPVKVAKGDCLWMLAQTYLGDGNRYKELYELNKDVIDTGNDGTGNPTYTIYPGQTLKFS